jgi:hypothetical protein
MFELCKESDGYAKASKNLIGDPSRPSVIQLLQGRAALKSVSQSTVRPAFLPNIVEEA